MGPDRGTVGCWRRLPHRSCTARTCCAFAPKVVAVLETCGINAVNLAVRRADTAGSVCRRIDMNAITLALLLLATPSQPHQEQKITPASCPAQGTRSFWRHP